METATKVNPTLPEGFRPMSALEGDQLGAVGSVLVYDTGLGCIQRFHVLRYSPHRGWQIGSVMSGEVVDSTWLDADDPQFWSDDDLAADNGLGRERRGPMSASGDVIAVMPIDDSDLAPLLRQSLYIVLAKEELANARLIRDLARGAQREAARAQLAEHADRVHRVRGIA